MRKPGAFENYRFLQRRELFPTSRFRMAWDALQVGNISAARQQNGTLEILELAAEAKERFALMKRCSSLLTEMGESGEGKLNADTVQSLLPSRRHAFARHQHRHSRGFVVQFR